MPATKRFYEALPNDANDKRPPGTWKVGMRWTDERGHHAQKFVQEVYKQEHAEAIALAMNSKDDLVEAAKEVLDTLNDGPDDRECPLTGRPKMACDCIAHKQLRAAIAKAEAR